VTAAATMAGLEAAEENPAPAAAAATRGAARASEERPAGRRRAPAVQWMLIRMVSSGCSAGTHLEARWRSDRRWIIHWTDRACLLVML